VRRSLAAGTTQGRADRKEFAGRSETQLRDGNDANDGNEANEKAILDQCGAVLIFADGIDQFQSL
jgi:hypothetical protein